MLIRSQSKTSLVNMDRVNVIYIAGGNTIQAFYSENDSDTLGIYSTEEKAMKVLDMIQNVYKHESRMFIMPADQEVEV